MTSKHEDELMGLVRAALDSPGLLDPNDFNLARYSLNPQTRNRLLDPDIMALEDYLIDYCGLPDAALNLPLFQAFGNVVHCICFSDTTPLADGYQRMAWLLAWLNTHHLPSFFGEDPDSPLQVLQIAAALGYGEWAAAYNQIEEGLDRVFTLANSSLWRVREASALGLYRMLTLSWERSYRRLRYQAMIANLAEWTVILTALAQNKPYFLLGASAQVLDGYHLLQEALRFISRLDPAQRGDPLYMALKTLFKDLMQAAVKESPLAVRQVEVWLEWGDFEVYDLLAHLDHSLELPLKNLVNDPPFQPKHNKGSHPPF